jgi:hypothetical protein
MTDFNDSSSDRLEYKNVKSNLAYEYSQCRTDRPLTIIRYDPGEELDIDIEGVFPKIKGQARFIIEKFIGGGFAGQVYKARLEQLQSENGKIDGLIEGNVYAVKIIKPPSSFSLLFRDFIYFLSFQGKFSQQVNYAAIRSCILWQKIIRRGAKVHFGSDEIIVDTYATFFDKNLQSYGIINEWVEGRVWKLEVDENMFSRWKNKDNEKALLKNSNSPEYVYKKLFMKKLVKLFHDMGAHELARQYEWWTTKSQPNVLKKVDSDNRPNKGLIAIDFNAGLALLPFLPMSPVDIKLIFKGIFRGSLIQFDRGNIKKLENFTSKNKDIFGDYSELIQELKQQDAQYRASLLDLTHHHFKLLINSKLRNSIKEASITGWKNIGRIDDDHEKKLSKSWLLFSFLLIISFLPFIGKFILKMWGNSVYRKRIAKCFKSLDYLLRFFRAKRLENLILWFQKNRIRKKRVLDLANKPFEFFFELLLFSWIPPSWHKFITDSEYTVEVIKEAIKFPYKLLTDPEQREKWLLDQVKNGKEEGILTQDEEERIIKQIKDPFIQKYLKSLAVHICTLPVSEICWGITAVIVFFTYGSNWEESLAYATASLAFFHVLPVSPGSLIRGIYVIYLMISERDIKNYWIAACISMWRNIGYFGFPIQMVAKYPTLSRFMACNWTREIVTKIPVFGEKGGLVEHIIFDLFFNLPLSIKRKLKGR